MDRCQHPHCVRPHVARVHTVCLVCAGKHTLRYAVVDGLCAEHRWLMPKAELLTLPDPIVEVTA